MADDAKYESSSHATGVQQRSSLPRQRLSLRSQTTPAPSWDATSSSHVPPPPVPRRRSSIFSDFSFDDTKRSTDNLFNPNPQDMEPLIQQEPTHWHSAPLLFAILPAVGGLLFNNGSAVVTDILLLGLATILLNWCVRMPWDWYHSAQIPASFSPSEPLGVSLSDAIPEEESEGDEPSEDIPTAEAKTAPEELNDEPQETRQPQRSPEYVAAVQDLRRDELFALASCFFGPVLGVYILHTIRASLSRPSEGLVSNYNLSIFLLAAEIRPVSHLLRMLRARTLYLQRVVRETSDPDITKTDQATVQDLKSRLGELESHIADTAANTSPKAEGTTTSPPNEVANIVRQSFQPQLDALNRAVRRYEKRATTQTMVTEARLQDLEARLRDALALAAAAAQSRQQKSGVAMLLLDWISRLFMLPLQAVWTLFIYPLSTAVSLIGSTKTWLIGPGKKADKKGKARMRGSHGHASLNGYRTQAGSGRR